MKTVTQVFGIIDDVPFLDVDVDDDNLWFVDPFKIRMGLGPRQFAAAANACTSSFFNEITMAVISSNPADRQRGLDLLQHFEEPPEVRLGMTEHGSDGHGGAGGVGEDIWDALNGDLALLVGVGVLHEIEDIPLFVAGIGNDITSDIVTRLIFQPLVDFTNDCVAKFPQLSGGSGLMQVRRQAWDPVSVAWVMIDVTLPSVGGNPLLLVPREWTTRNLLLNATRLYDTKVLDHVQLKRAVVDSKGKLLKTPKYRLREEPRLRRGYSTIIRIVEEAYGEGTDIVAMFKRWASERYRESA